MNEPISIVKCCDCMDFMAEFEDKFFDLAIVDPPYGIGLDFQFRHGLGNRSIHKEKQWNDMIPGPEYFNELYRVSKEQIIWGCNYYTQYIKSVGRIIHDKIMDIENTKINFSEADLASCSLQKRITIFRYRWNGNRQGNKLNWDNSGPDRRIHPTQKPISLYKWLLHNYAKEGDKIIDTHLGSQSSRIAAYKMGFDFWGCEIDEDYFRDGCKRFEIEKSQQTIKF